MKITCLIENTTIDPALSPRHGLSLFIETRGTNILFDMGPDDQFLANAGQLGLDPASVGFAILSHGHRDHGGGIPPFQAVCPDTQIFMADTARHRFKARMLNVFNREIGLDWQAIDESRCRFIHRDTPLSETLTLFKGFDAKGFMPSANASLYKTLPGGKDKLDDFSHELALLVQEENNTILFTGCSHSGIGNMVAGVLERSGLKQIDAVVGGFHLFNPITRKTESKAEMDGLAEELSGFSRTRFYTGHCTGARALDYLQSKLGDQIQPLRTGSRITL